MQKNIFSALFLLMFGQHLMAQAPFFSYNLYRYNPAAAATNSEWAANLGYTAYWMGISGYNKVTDINVQKRFAKLNSAIGLNIYNNVIGEGNLFRRDFNLSYAYQWKMTQKENSPILALGLESGFSRRIINSPSRSYEIWNPISRSFANLNMGIHFYLPQEKFYIGASVSDILQTDVISNPTYLPFYQLMSGYRFGLGKKFFLQPNILLKMTSQYNNFNTNVQLQHTKWEVGMGYVFAHPYTPLDYNYNRYLAFNAGVCIKKRFHIRYLYDYSLSSLSNSISQGSHSMLISYRSLK